MDPQNLLPGSDEDRVREILRVKKGWHLVPEDIQLEVGTTASVDGIDHVARVMIEVVGWSGRNTSTRDDKIVADAAKLWLLRKHLGQDYRVFVICCGRPFAANFQGGLNASGVRKWAALAIRALGVDIEEVSLDPQPSP